MKWFALFGMLVMATPSYAACTNSSGEKRVSLLELYTSEGCSSCPPADRWLSQLSENGFKATQVVPLAFHVDYWDYIGWKDAYAKAEFSDRQRHAARLKGSNTVYTPQFMLNGADFRSWFRGARLKEQVQKTNQEPAALKIHLKLNDIRQLTVDTTIQQPSALDSKNHQLFIAIYENGLKTAVSAGENKGRQLTHDYVVREWYGPFRLDQLDQGHQKTMSIGAKWFGKDAGVAAFVQNANTGEILQAASLKMCS
jgi:hypothetical protein